MLLDDDLNEPVNLLPAGLLSTTALMAVHIRPRELDAAFVLWVFPLSSASGVRRASLVHFEDDKSVMKLDD